MGETEPRATPIPPAPKMTARNWMTKGSAGCGPRTGCLTSKTAYCLVSKTLQPWLST